MRLLQRPQRHRTVIVRFGIIRTQGQGPINAIQRLRVKLKVRQGHGAEVPGLGYVAIARQNLVEADDRLLPPPGLQKGGPAIVVSLHIVAVQGQGAVMAGDGFVQPAQSLQRDAAIVPIVAQVRAQGQGAVVALHRLRGAAQLPQRLALPEKQVVGRGAEGDGGLVMGQSRRRIALVGGQQPEQIARRRHLLRRAVQKRAIHGLGLVQSPLAVELGAALDGDGVHDDGTSTLQWRALARFTSPPSGLVRCVQRPKPGKKRRRPAIIAAKHGYARQNVFGFQVVKINYYKGIAEGVAGPAIASSRVRAKRPRHQNDGEHPGIKEAVHDLE